MSDRVPANTNHCRYRESLQNLTPADVYFGSGQTVLLENRRDQTRHHQIATITTSLEGRLNSNPKGARTSVPLQLGLSQSI